MYNRRIHYFTWKDARRIILRVDLPDTIADGIQFAGVLLEYLFRLLDLLWRNSYAIQIGFLRDYVRPVISRFLDIWHDLLEDNPDAAERIAKIQSLLWAL